MNQSHRRLVAHQWVSATYKRHRRGMDKERAAGHSTYELHPS